MNKNTTVILFPLLILLTIVMSTAMFGCGKKGMPKPQDKTEAFAWESAVASYNNGCINISAELSGNVSNIDGIILQVEPMSSADSCVGCPFIAKEEQGYEYNSIVLSGSETSVAINFYPSVKAEAYRWRLIGRNIIGTFPYEMTSLQLLLPETGSDLGIPLSIQ